MQESIYEAEKGQSGDTGEGKARLFTWIFAVAAIVILIASIVMLVSLSKPTCLTVSDTQLTVEDCGEFGYSATVTGVAKNTSGRDLSYASVEFSVYDAAGNNLGTALAYIYNLRKDGTWRFEACLVTATTEARPSSFGSVKIKGL